MTAANLVDRVLPGVLIRQRVLRFPMPLRFGLAARLKLRDKVRVIVLRVLLTYNLHAGLTVHAQC